MPGAALRSASPARATALAEPKCASSARLRAAPDPRHLVERRRPRLRRPLRPVRADREAVRLVAQPLHEVEHRVAVPERHRRLAGAVELLLAGVAVDALGDADHRDLVDAELLQRRAGRRHLPRPAVDQHEVGPGVRLPVRILLGEPREAPGQHLAHHPEVVAGRQVVERMLNLRYCDFRNPSGPATIIAPTAFVPMMWLLS